MLLAPRTPWDGRPGLGEKDTVRGDVKETPAPGFTIRRDLFDQALADAAKDAGAEILLSTRSLSGDRLEEVIKHCWVAFREYYERSG